MVRGKTQKLGDILRNVLSRRSIAGNFQIRQIQTSLGRILEEEEIEHVRAGSVRNGRLTLMVDSPSMIYELEAFKSREIVERLRSEGHSEIQKIRFEFEKQRK
jgi:hypothetical protein